MTREELKVLAHKAILKKQVGVSTLDIRLWKWLDRDPEGVTRELGDRADKGFGPYTSLIKAAFMGGFTG